MGYWSQDRSGTSFAVDDLHMTWGDAPADIMGDALERIVGCFEGDLGRKPTQNEILAGLRFSLIFNELEDREKANLA